MKIFKKVNELEKLARFVTEQEISLGFTTVTPKDTNLTFLEKWDNAWNRFRFLLNLVFQLWALQMLLILFSVSFSVTWDKKVCFIAMLMKKKTKRCTVHEIQCNHLQILSVQYGTCSYHHYYNLLQYMIPALTIPITICCKTLNEINRKAIEIFFSDVKGKIGGLKILLQK